VSTHSSPGPDSGRSQRAATLVSAGIFISRISGLIRTQLTAAVLGGGGVADAFVAAFRIPNLLQNLLGEGVLSASFIPVYSQSLDEGDEKKSSQLAGAIGGLLGLASSIVVVIGIVAARPITSLLVWGFEGETFELTVSLVRIMFIGTGFLVMSAWCLGILNSHRKFFLSYVAPTVWNGAQIAVLTMVAVLGWSTRSAAEALAWGVVIGGILQFLIQLPSVRAVAPDLRLSISRAYPGVDEVLSRFGPAVMGRGVVQLAAYLDLLLASFLFTGAVAALGYAQILYLLPISLFAMSVAAAELPELSRSANDDPAVIRRVQTGLERVGFFVAFVTAAYLAAGRTIVEALYQRGEFDPSDTTVVTLVLGAYSLGLLSISASRLVQNTLYAKGDVRGPARIAGLRVAVAAGVGLVLMMPLDNVVVAPDGTIGGTLPDVPQAVAADLGWGTLGAVGLALGSAVGAWLEFFLLRRRLRGEINDDIRIWRSVARSLPAAAVSLGTMALLGELTEEWPALLAAAVVVGIGGIVYVGVCLVKGPPQAAQTVDAVRRRVARR